jgi:tetratricopeptide (TPR) repeat protein
MAKMIFLWKSPISNRARRLISLAWDKIKRVPLWVFPLLVSLFLALPSDGMIHVSSDGLEYSSTALNVARGLWSHPDGSPIIRRPLYLLYLAFCYSLLGFSEMTTFLAFRTFYILNPLVVYALARRLYEKRIGLVATLLVLSSSTIGQWSMSTTIDHILAFFMTLSVLLVLLAFERRTWAGFVLAGISLAVAYLVKEMAVILFPLPVLMLASIKEYRCRRCLWGTLLQLAVVAAVVLPWTGYVYSVDPAMILGRRAGFVSQSLQTGSSLLDFLRQTLLALPDYYAQNMSPYLVLAPLLVVAWVYAWVSSVRGGKADRTMGLVILLYCPILVFQGRVGFRPRLAMGFFLILYIALARLLSAIARYIGSLSDRFLRPDRARLVRIAIPILIPLVVIILQGGMEKSGSLWEYAEDFNTVAFLRLGSWHLEEERYHRQTENIQWLFENVPPDSAFLGWQGDQRATSFLSENRYSFWQFPLLLSDDIDFSFQSEGQGVVLLFIDDRGNQYSQDSEYSQLSAVTEDQLQAVIDGESIDYVVLGLRGALAQYFFDSPGVVKVHGIECAKLQVFQVLEFEPSSPMPLITEEAVAFLEGVRLRDPERYEWLVSDFFGSRLGWTEEDVQQVYTSPTISDLQVVTPWEYAQRVQAEGRLETAIALHQHKAELVPGNPWPYVTLGALYMVKGDQAAALDSYEQAVRVAPDYRDVVPCIGVDVGESYLPLYLTRRDTYHTPVVIETLGDEEAYITYRFLDHLGTAEIAYESDHHDVRRSAFLITGEPRGVLFQHPSSRVSYVLQAPPSGHLRFSLALSPDVWIDREGDGVQYDVLIDDGYSRWRPLSTYVNPKGISDHQRWHDHEIDLSQWAGTVITLTFETGPGPDGNYDYDWAGWGEPRVVQPIAYDFLAELPNADLGGAGEESVRQDVLDLDYEPRPVLFHHPPYRVTYRVDVPDRAGLHFGLGMDPAAWSPGHSDGMEYNIYVRDPDRPYELRQVFHRHVSPRDNPEDQHWLDHVVDLGAYGGKAMDIVLETLPGPAGDSTSDWGGWSMPVLIADDVALFDLDAQGDAPMGDSQP